MKEVTLFRDFSEDLRTSMEIYADQLIKNLLALDHEDITFNEYRPKLGSLTRLVTEKGNLRMRTARYLSYPVQARKHKGTLNHILDHGYAHLLKVLDPERTIITVHDIIPILASRGKINGDNKSRKRWLSEYTGRFYKSARHIIAISENTKRDLVTYCKCKPESITVVYYGVNKIFKPINNINKNQFRKTLGLPQDHSKMVLITGQQFYKNQSTSLKVMETLYQKHEENITLVRVGRTSPDWVSALSDFPLRTQVINIDHLSPEKMVDLYNAVDCLLFPSWYEGFGNPPLEAMACGAPVVTSNTASLPEVVDKAGLMFAPDDVEGMAGAVEKLLTDQEFRNSQIRKGLEHVKKFDWRMNATRTLEIYRTLLKE